MNVRTVTERADVSAATWARASVGGWKESFSPERTRIAACSSYVQDFTEGNCRTQGFVRRFYTGRFTRGADFPSALDAVAHPSREEIT
jgi:hypothetical protein